VKIAVLGATGRIGRLLVSELLQRGHQVSVLIRDPKRLSQNQELQMVVGQSRDRQAVADLLEGAEAVVSALGPTVAKDPTVHQDTAVVLIETMQRAGVSRFVGISGAGIDVPGDQKSRRDRTISWLVKHLSGAVFTDKVAEYQLWAASDRDWNLIRAPRLDDSAKTGMIEHDAHRSTRLTTLTRADLVAFVADVVEKGSYCRQAPFVANSR
jgi:nucleoside-diphosphate-sugar epimerase